MQTRIYYLKLFLKLKTDVILAFQRQDENRLVSMTSCIIRLAFNLFAQTYYVY